MLYSWSHIRRVKLGDTLSLKTAIFSQTQIFLDPLLELFLVIRQTVRNWMGSILQSYLTIILKMLPLPLVFKCELSATDSYVQSLGPQLLVLFWKFVELMRLWLNQKKLVSGGGWRYLFLGLAWTLCFLIAQWEMCGCKRTIIDQVAPAAMLSTEFSQPWD